MDRRGFVRMLGASVVLAPLALRAQTAKRRRIGILSPAPPSNEARFRTFWLAPLRQLGWIDGGNIAFEMRLTGDEDRLLAAAEELVRLKVDLIFAPGTGAALAAKKATTAIPIV